MLNDVGPLVPKEAIARIASYVGLAPVCLSVWDVPYCGIIRVYVCIAIPCSCLMTSRVLKITCARTTLVSGRR